MKSVLISIQPKWCEKIADGRNTNKPQYEWENIERAPQSWMYVEEVQNVKNKG